MIKKLVISYSDIDRDIANKLRKKLESSGYDVWIANKDIRGAVLWTQTILDAIDETDGLVLLWSLNAKKSEDVHEEIRIARVFLKPVFPILAYPMEKTPSLPNEIKRLQVINEGDFNLTVTELLGRFTDENRNHFEYPELSQHGHIPMNRNPYFVGRDAELKRLFVDAMGFHGESRIGIPIAISGLAGIGKTHLALTFAHRFNLFFPDGVFWIHTPNGIVQELGKIGSFLQVKKLREEHPRDYARKVHSRLCHLRNGLLIFDNVSDFSEFQEWCPKGNQSCSVILTTRKKPRGFAVKVMSLTELDVETACQLIISRREDRAQIIEDKEQYQAIRKICEKLGNHPLALEQCASYLQSNIVQPTKIFHELEHEKNPLTSLEKEKYKIFLDQGAANTLQVLKKNYDSLNRNRIDPYFLLMCLFAPHGINIELITDAYGKKDEGREALEELERNSLIYGESKVVVSLHPLVGQYGRILSRTEKFDYHKKFVELVVDFLQNNRTNLSNEQVQKELPHVLEAINVSKEHELWKLSEQLHSFCANIVTEIDERIDLLKSANQIIHDYLPSEKKKQLFLSVQLGKAYRTKGNFKEAMAEFNSAEELYQKYSDVNPDEIVSMQFEIGDFYIALGQYNFAKRILNHAKDKAINQAKYDLTAPQVTQIEQALGKIELFLGNYGPAEETFERILEQRKHYYDNLPDVESEKAVSSSYADLSRMALKRGNYLKAIEYVQEASKFIEASFKEDDPVQAELDLLLCTIYFESGNYNLAKEQLEITQKVFLSIFGEKHPSYARSLVVSGEIYRKLGHFIRALGDIDEAIKIFKEQYGENHSSVAEALAVKGKVYDHQGEFGKEEKVWERVLKIQEEVYKLNLNHPALAETRYDYASLYLNKGEYDKASEQLGKSLTITKESLGETHPEYFGRLVRLARCFYEQREYLKAAKKLKEARNLQEKIFRDAVHPYVARMLQLESEVNRRLGRFDKALNLIDEAIAMKRAIYGEKHPSVAEALAVQGKIYDHLSRYEEEETVWKQVLKIQQAVYPANHPILAMTHYDYASLYLNKGDYDQASEQLEKSLDITRNSLEEIHPEYFGRLVRLAHCYYEKQEYSEAEKKLKEARKLGEKIFGGDEHPYVGRMLQLESEVNRRLGRFDKALNLIDEAIAMKRAIYGEKHPSVAEALAVQGKIYDHLSRYEEEETVWKQVLKIQQAVYPANHPALAETYYDYASLSLHKGDYDQASEQLEKSLDITRNSLGEIHPEYFGRLVRLAHCYYEKREYSEAEKKLKEARKLGEKIFGGDEHPYVGRMLQLESEVNRRLGRFDKALNLIDEAIAMKRAIYGEKHPSVAEALAVQGKIYDHLSRYEEEETVWKQVLKIQQAVYPANHPALAETYYDYASLSLHKGDYDQASEQLEKSLDITRNSLGEIHPEYFGRLVRLAHCYYEKREYSEAEKKLKEARKLGEKIFGGDEHPYVGRMLQLESEVNRRLGRFDKALNLIDEAIAMKRAIYGEKHPSVAEALAVQGKIYDHLSRYEEEETVWKQVLKIQQAVYPANHPALAETYYDYASLSLHKGDYDQASEQLEKSLDITRNSLGEIHPEYFGRLVRLAHCYYEKQEYSEAEKKLKEARKLGEKIFGGDEHPYVGRMLQLDSQVKWRLGQFDEMYELIDEAIRIKKAIYGEVHPSVAEALEIKVDILLDQFRVDDSEELLDKIKEIREKSYGKDHLAFANYLLRLAQYYLIRRQYTEAREPLENSLDICLEKYESKLDHPEILKRQVLTARLFRITSDITNAERRINEAIEALGSRIESEESLIITSILKESAYIRRKKGDFIGSLEAFENALNIETSILGSGSRSVIELLIEKVKLLMVSHQLKDAKKTIDDATSRIKDNIPVFQGLKANLLEQRGILEIKENNHSKAIESFDEAITIKENIPGRNEIDTEKLWVEKAVALRISGKYNEALLYLEKAQNINNLFLPEDHIYFARICLENGKTYYEKRSYPAGKEQLEEALKIYMAQPDQDLKEHADAAEMLGQIFLDTGFETEALPLIVDALGMKVRIYNISHPEIAETLKKLEESLPKLVGNNHNEMHKLQAATRKKLNEALQTLKNHKEAGIEISKVVERLLTIVEN
jgi:tetratricopeptide (TPR) repeat protein